MVARSDATDRLRRYIRECYGHTCAACGVSGRLVADVAHLFEDATTREPIAATLIILCPNCNQAEARSKGLITPPLSERFTAHEVECRARAAHREGDYRLAYQGFRLAAYLYELQQFPSHAVECLVDAISALRPIRWGPFLAATACEVERLCDTADVGLIQRWLFLDRLALVLFDYCRWREAGDVREAAGRLRSRIRGDQRYPENLWFDLASSFRREAMIRALTTDVPPGELDGLLTRLLEDARVFRRSGHLDSFATNLDVAGKLELEVRRDPRRAHELSEEALELAPKITHNWVLQEHRWREATFFHAQHDQSKTADHVAAALALFGAHPVILEPRLGSAGPVPYDPISILEGFGIPIDELRERNIAPRGNSPRALPLGLSIAQVGDLVRAATTNQRAARSAERA